MSRVPDLISTAIRARGVNTVHVSWHSEREEWAKEKAALEASLAYKESHMDVLKKEYKRLARVVGETKRENERLGRESSRLREERSSLLARNARLDARNLEVRQQIEALAERNRKLKATVERELLGDINPNSAASTSSRKRKVATDRKSPAAEVAASSVKLEENAHSIVVPIPGRRPVEAVAPVRSSGSSSRGTHRQRHRRSHNSDTDEVVTPRSTAPGEDRDLPAATARDRAGTVIQGVGGWHQATEAAVAAHGARQRAGLGLVGAPPPPLGCSKREGIYGGEKEARGLVAGARCSPVMETEVASASEDGVLLGDGSSRRASPAATDSPCGSEREQASTSIRIRVGGRGRGRGERSRSSDSCSGAGGAGGGSGGSCRSSSVTLSAAAAPNNETDRPEDGAFPPPPPPPPPRQPPSSERMQPAPSHFTRATVAAVAVAPADAADASNQGARPIYCPSTTSKPSCSSSSGRKRSRLSLGGGAEDRPHATVGRAVEITEVLEAPRPRSAAAAAAAAAAAGTAGARAAGAEPAPRSPVMALAEAPTSEARARGRTPLDGYTAEARRRGNPNGIQSFPGALLAAERIGSSHDGASSRRGAGGGSGDALEGGRPDAKQAAGKPQRRPKKQTPGQQKPPRQFLGQRRAKAVSTSSAAASTDPSMRTPQRRSDSDHARKDGAISSRDSEQLGRKHGDTSRVASARERGDGQWGVAGGGAGGDSGVTATASTTGHDVMYPRLTMAAVNSPKKKARSRRRQHSQHQDEQEQEQRQRQQQDVTAAGSSNPRGCDRRSGSPTAGASAAAAAAAAAAADDGMGEIGRRPPTRLSESSDGDSSRGGGDTGGGAGDELSAGGKDENENSAPLELAGDGALNQDGQRRQFTEADSRVSPTDPQGLQGSGGGERKGCSGKKQEAPVAATAAAPAIARHQVVANPYAAARGTNSGGGGGGGKRTREDRPTNNYKFQEVVRDRAKRTMMKGHDCEHCAAYLAAVGGSPGERKAMLDMCSRHKYTEANGRPAETPDGFWDLSFVDSIDPNKELEQRGGRPNKGREGNYRNGQLAGDDASLGF